MAYDFPNSPTNGQQYTPAGGSTYTWDAAGTKWTVTGTGITGLATASIVDVITGTSTSVAVTPDALAGLWEKGTALASAANLIIPNTGGAYFHVTGTTTITDIDWATAKDGRWVWLVFDGILTLTHGSNLVLPGGYNIVTVPGDRALFIQEAGDTVYCMHFQRTNVHPSMYASYTPGSGLGVNMTSASPSLSGYFRVGDMVTVTGHVDIDPVAIDTPAIFNLTAPIAPNGGTFLGPGQAAGVFVSQTTKSQGGGISAAVGTASVHCEFIPANVAAAGYKFVFSYQM